MTAQKRFPATEYLLLALTMALRFYRLGAQSLWSDEGNSLALARAGLAEIAARTALDIHPPLYYWLLKGWLAMLGQSEFAARSLSAGLGVLLAAMVYRLGRRLFGRRAGRAAMFAAAVSPFQVYYAQEARMYMLLALLGTASVWAAVEWWTATESRRRWLSAGGYALSAAMGLYTQYAFPVVLAALNLTALVALWPDRRRLGKWLALQAIPVALYAPWLPVAWRQVTTWPAPLEAASAGSVGLSIARTLSLGLSASAAGDGWLWGFGGLAVWGATASYQLSIVNHQKLARHALRSHWPLLLVLLWLLLPVGLTAALFRPAYLKFLLVASPALCLLLGKGFQLSIVNCQSAIGTRTALRTTLLLLIAVPSLLSLRAYYADPAFQRDDYRGIAALIEAVGTAGDAVILDAPGQQEVFGYYYRGAATVYPLPRQRPPDPAATAAELETIAAGAQRIYAVYWGEREADPEGVVEGWLNEHTFKASDVWFGNVRLARYAAPPEPPSRRPLDVRLGEAIRLTGYGLSATQVAPGDLLAVSLWWEADAAPPDEYTVFLQLLDGANHLVGQRDASPRTPTRNWPPGQTVADGHGLLVEPGTPPGPHRLIAGLYRADTGERLRTPDGADFVTLATVQVTRNPSPLPPAAFRITHRLDAPPLLGYDLYPLGRASAPETPLRPGEPLHLNLYWQRPPTPPADDTLELRLVNRRGDVAATWHHPVAGAPYPMTEWADGEIVRAQFDLFLPPASPGRYRLDILLDGKPVGRTHLFPIE